LLTDGRKNPVGDPHHPNYKESFEWDRLYSGRVTERWRSMDI